jgi:hypothetical protein
LCGSGIEIQLAAIIAHAHFAGEFQPKVADGLVGELTAGAGKQFVINDPLGLTVFALEGQAASFGQVFEGIGVGRIIGAAGPEGAFVELEAFAVDAAENHGAEPAIADGHCFDPRDRGPTIPETQRSIGGRCLAEQFAGEFRVAGARTKRKGAGDRFDHPAGLGIEGPLGKNTIHRRGRCRDRTLGDFGSGQYPAIDGGLEDAAFETIATGRISANAERDAADGHAWKVATVEAGDFLAIHVQLHDAFGGAVDANHVGPLLCREFGVVTAHAFGIEEAEGVAGPGVQHVALLGARLRLVENAAAGFGHPVGLHPGLESDLVGQVQGLVGFGLIDRRIWG